MSCNCQNTDTTTADFPCPCDDFVFPLPLNIGAGLTDLPRQIGGFPDFRRAMLYAIRGKSPALDAWQANKPDDMGLMLLEMWAYVCDVLSFYDKVIAQEVYIGTAQQRSSLRKLVALLGYLPTPAIAGTVTVAAKASGRQLVTVPAGTAFRSGAFNGNPPQVFELLANTVIDPLANSWSILAPHPPDITTTPLDYLLVNARIVPKSGALLLVVNTSAPSKNSVVKVDQAGPYVGVDGNKYTKISFVVDPYPTEYRASVPTVETSKLGSGVVEIDAVKYPSKALKTTSSPAVTGILEKIEATSGLVYKGHGLVLDDLTPVSELQLWMFPSTANVTAASTSASTINLDKLDRQIRINDYILLSSPTYGNAWYQVTLVADSTVTGEPGSATVAGITYATPGIQTTVTQLTLSTAPPFSDPAQAQVTIYYGMQTVGTITNEADTALADGDSPFTLIPPVAPPTITPLPSLFLAQDVNQNGASFNGAVAFPNGGGTLTLGTGQSLGSAVTLPVQVYGNPMALTRGQTVAGEILGNGDATQAGQTFQLQKSPLTYLTATASDNNKGITNTLAIYINGIQWMETPSFYGQGASDQVYIVRQDDNGNSLVTFGDGIRGQRLPTGTANIIANYRYGAGLASPPAGSVNQIAKAVPGLQSILNPVAATAGSDAQTGSSLQTSAPRSALLLGRAVSILDMEAAALSYPGVITAAAEWRWEKNAQCPLVKIWYIGDPSIASTLLTRLNNISDPTVLIKVVNAQANSVALGLAVSTDSRYVPASVQANVVTALTDPSTGMLTTGNLGIGNPLFRSQVFEAVLAVPGTVAVTGITWGGAGFSQYAQTPGKGKYFEFVTQLSVTCS